jgi:hypothetical protein
LTQNKDFHTVYLRGILAQPVAIMEKTKHISQLLRSDGRLLGLDAKLQQRCKVLEEVRTALPGRLAQAVVSAGVDGGRLTIGVVGSVWASRIRYCSQASRTSLSEKLGIVLSSVRIRVVPGQEVSPPPHVVP